MKRICFFLFFTQVIFFQASGQQLNDQQLKKIDSIAFAALEENSPDVLDKADNLLKASLNQPTSFYSVNAYTIFGIVNKNRGYYVTSLDYYLKALNAAEKINDIPRRSACLNNIGSVYQLQGKFQLAIDYFYKSLELEKKLQNPLQKSIRYYNLGECYKDLDNLEMALTFFNNSLLIEKKAKNNEGIAYAQLGIADVYIRIKRYTDAEITLNETKRLLIDNHSEEIIIYHKLCGKLKKELSDLDGALQEFTIGENLSKKFKIFTNISELLKNQIDILEIKSNWQKAASKYKELIEINEKLNSAQIKNQLDDLNFRNELVKKQLEIELVQEERDLFKKNEQFEKELRIYSQKLTWFVVILLVSFLTLIVFGIKKLTNNKE
jgi:tetratricopeptide (TPR) repeat protein